MQTKPEAQWRKNSDTDPFWKHNGRIEIKYIDGTIKIWVNPSMAKGEMTNVTEWRPTEKMPKFEPPTMEQLTKIMEDRKKLDKSRKVGGGHPLPTVFRHLLKVEWFRTFGWRERFAILFGANVVVAIGIATQHNPGEHQPLVMGKVTLETAPDEYMRGIVEAMMNEKSKEPGGYLKGKE